METPFTQSPDEPLSIARRVQVWDRALELIRSTLRSAGLREVSTPVLVQAPASEAGIQPILAPPGYLATGPEQAMKRLLCLGSGPIFQVSHVFRAGEPSPRHREELHRLNWYRLEDSADAVRRDVESLLACCFAAAGRPGPTRWRRIGLLDLLEETLGLSLRGDEDADELRHRVAALREGAELLGEVPPGRPSAALTLSTWDAVVTQWSDRYLAPWLQAQPGVGVHLGDYPAVLCAMAATGAEGWASQSRAGQKLTHRFTSFVGGIKCASGSRELRDPDEQQRRLRLANQLRELEGLRVLPLEHSFLAALRDPGMPACAGVALDVDRALMVACGVNDLHQASTQLDPVPAPWAGGRAVGRAAQLVAPGLVDPQTLPQLAQVEARLAVTISPTMQELLRRRDDPIGLQLVPDVRELAIAPQERLDPIGDAVHTLVPGLIQRYPDRVLLKPTHLCAVYCRFCFRRDVVGDPAGATLAPEALAAALQTIRQRPQIWEVILTGGDPLVLAPSRLAALLSSLMAIPHVRVIRIHTRVPLVAPERVTPALVRALRGKKPVYVVLHTNHDSEFTPTGAAACAALIDAGIPMLSQSVLLKGVNDSPAALEALFRTLVTHRIKPYYLHHPDLVEGTSHLRVSLEAGRALVRGLRGRLSGLCQPTYVLDIPGGFGKVPAGAAWIEGPEPDGSWRITDPAGGQHPYREPIPPEKDA